MLHHTDNEWHRRIDQMLFFYQNAIKTATTGDHATLIFYTCLFLISNPVLHYRTTGCSFLGEIDACPCLWVSCLLKSTSQTEKSLLHKPGRFSVLWNVIYTSSFHWPLCSSHNSLLCGRASRKTMMTSLRKLRHCGSNRGTFQHLTLQKTVPPFFLFFSSFPGIEMKTCGLSGMRSPSPQCTHEASRDSFTLTEPFSQIGSRINMPCRTAGKCRNSSGLKSGEINVSQVSS